LACVSCPVVCLKHNDWQNLRRQIEHKGLCAGYWPTRRKKQMHKKLSGIIDRLDRITLALVVTLTGVVLLLI